MLELVNFSNNHIQDGFILYPVKQHFTIDSETKVYDKKYCLISAAKTQQNKRQKGAGKGAKAILFPDKTSSLHLMQLGEIKPLCLVALEKNTKP